MRKADMGFVERVRWQHFLRDFPAVYATAQSERIELGTYAAVKLRKFGVGVPPLWPLAYRHRMPLPLGVEAFQAMAQLPGSVFWAGTTDSERIRVSRHVEFVGEIARVAEAVDPIEPGRADSERYALYLEPAADILARCVDTAGFDGQDVGYERRSHLSGWFPMRGQPGEDGVPAARVVPDDEMRRLLVKLTCGSGQQPLVTEQKPINADDLPVLATAPTRTEVLNLFERFYDHPR